VSTELAAERHAVDEAITRRVDTSGDRFSMSVNGTRWRARADAANALRNAWPPRNHPASTATTNRSTSRPSPASKSSPPPAATSSRT